MYQKSELCYLGMLASLVSISQLSPSFIVKKFLALPGAIICQMYFSNVTKFSPNILIRPLNLTSANQRDSRYLGITEH